LLPSNMDGEAVQAFLDEIVGNVNQNEYLKTFLRRAKTEGFDDLKNKADTHGLAVFPSAVAYGLVLDRLTNAMITDYRILEVCIGVFRKAAEVTNMKDYIDPMEWDKIQLVEAPMLGYVYFHKQGAVTPDFAKVELPENIIWAVNIDNYLGFTDNAEAGSVLAHYHPDYNGAGPARFSEDGKIILLSMPEAHKWADLYSIWNMAFMSHYDNFPLVIAKLLIPSVSGYQDNPDGYIYPRSLALYAHLYARLITKAENAQAGVEDEIKWSDDRLSKLWGEVSKESSLDYVERVENQ
jgi:hypothetical protein